MAGPSPAMTMGAELQTKTWPAFRVTLTDGRLVALRRYRWPAQGPAMTVKAGFIRDGSATAGRCELAIRPR
jgi:hypothetical protein